ncbi:MAG: hypothetical protein AB1609_21520 [Bacillota bacterium]
MSRWSEEQIREAVAIAAATSIREAQRRTGVPLATLHRHLRKAGIPSGGGTGNGGRKNGNHSNGRRAPVMPPIGEEVRERVIEQVAGKLADTLAERLERLADQLYKLAEKAVDKVDAAISDPGERQDGKRGESHDRDGAAWVRALVGVMAQAVEKAQLLSGRPTKREAVEGQVTTRHEHDYTLRHIVEQRLAEAPGSPLAALFARRAGAVPGLPADRAKGAEEAAGRN